MKLQPLLFVTLLCTPVLAERQLPPDLLSPWQRESLAWTASRVCENVARAPGVFVTSPNKSNPVSAIASRVIDGNPKTEWATSETEGTLQIEFPQLTHINGVFLERDISSEHPWDARLGCIFDIEVTIDGKSWERVTGSGRYGLRITKWAVLFEPVAGPAFPDPSPAKKGDREVKALRLRTHQPARIGEFGAFRFDPASAQKMDWKDTLLANRIPLDMRCVNQRPDGLCSAGANLALARGDEKEIVSLDSVRIIADGKVCPSLFMPADEKNPETGWLYWRESSGTRGTRQLYFHVCAKDKKVLPPYVGEWTTANALLVKGQTIAKAVPGRPQFVSDSWIVPSLREGLRCGISVGFDNFIRSKPIAATVELSNGGGRLFQGTLAVSLTTTDFSKTFPLLSREVVLEPGQNKTLQENLDVSRVATGDYALTAQLVKDRQVYIEVRRPMFIASVKQYGMSFGIYGIPYWNGLTGYAQGIRAAAETGFTELTGQYWGEKYSFLADRALRYGVLWGPTIEPIYVQNSYADQDPSALCTGPDGKRVQWHPYCCYTHPEVVKRTEADAEQWIKEIVTHPGFDGRLVCDDDVHLADRGCYNDSCRALFKQTTGLDIPQPNPERTWNPKDPVPPGIVADDHPWLQWYLFRCSHIRGNLARIYMRAKNRVCPEAKMGAVRGHMQFPFYTPHTGEYPPLFDALYDVPGSYAYLYWVRQQQDYIAHGALASIGNRDKGPWILGDFSSWPAWILEKQTDDRWMLALMKSLNEAGVNGNIYPVGCLNKQIWCMLAGGFKFIHMFHLTERGARDDIHGTEQERLLQDWGERVRTHGYLMSALKEPVRPVAILVSITSSAFTEGLGHSGVASGVFKDCLHEHVAVDMIAEEEILAGGLKGRRVLLLPDLNYLRRSVVEPIAKFIAEGGVVIADADAAIKPAGSHVAKRSEMAKLAAGIITDRMTCDNPVVVAREFEYDGVKYYYLVNVFTDRWSAGIAEDAWCNGDNSAFTELYTPRTQEAKLRLPVNAGAAWDVFGNHELSVDCDGNMPVTLRGDDGILLALFPKKMERIAMTCPSAVKAGSEIVLEAKLIAADGKPVQGGVPMRISVTDPRGNDSEYSQHGCSAGGVLKHRFRTAVNDLPGTWKVTIRSLIGKTETSVAFRLSP